MATTIPIPVLTILQALDHEIASLEDVLAKANLDMPLKPATPEEVAHLQMIQNFEEAIEEKRPLRHHVTQLYRMMPDLGRTGPEAIFLDVDIADFSKFGLDNLKLFGDLA